jgi:hypothetical protein
MVDIPIDTHPNQNTQVPQLRFAWHMSFYNLHMTENLVRETEYIFIYACIRAFTRTFPKMVDLDLHERS